MQIVVNNKTRQIVSNVIGRYINSPEQRLLQGATALAIQPAFDYYNPKADKETNISIIANIRFKPENIKCPLTYKCF